MNSKKLNKHLLADMILGNLDFKKRTELLEYEEVKTLMGLQWENPQELASQTKPDFHNLLQKIRANINYGDLNKSTSTILLTSEIDALKNRNLALKKRIAYTIGIAATILLLVTIGSIYVLSTNKIFQKTYTQNIAPKGQKSQVILPDGTTVYLNSGTILKYDNIFGKLNRDVEMVGEAYFEVAHNERLPFIIHTKEIEIEVTGTKFNVMAYPEEDYVETIVSEGKVKVSEVEGLSSFVLTANQKASYHKPSKLLVKGEVKTTPYIGWKDNVLTFDNENFNEVIKKLERWYNISIKVNGKDSLEDRFTLTVRHESLKEVLDLINITTPFRYTINQDKVVITYK
jgi:transmembrane sensor